MKELLNDAPMSRYNERNDHDESYLGVSSMGTGIQSPTPFLGNRNSRLSLKKSITGSKLMPSPLSI